jgi:tetratricopeptide (TPR) repeat protein
MRRHPFFIIGMNKVFRFSFYLVILGCAFCTVFLIYFKGFPGPMLLDDQINLEHTKLYSLDRGSLLHVVTHNYSGILGRGFSTLTLGFTHFFHGSGTFYYKYHNFMIHCLTGLALFYLGLRLLLLTRHNDKALAIAALAAFIWLIHPIQVSTVLYIVQRMAQLSALFTLSALICYVVGRIRIEEERRFGVSIIVTGYPFFLILGLLSKENAALCILFALIIEAFFFSPFETRLIDKTGINPTSKMTDKRFLRRWFIRSCFIVLPLALGVAGFSYKMDSFLAGYEGRPFSLSERLLTQIDILFYYLQLILLPRLSEYSLYHDDFPIVTQFGWGTFFRLSIIVGVAALSVVSIAKKRANLILFGLAWFLVAHAMESTVIPLEMIFEHRNYLASYGVVFALSVFLVAYLPEYIKSTKISYGVTAIFCVLCTFILFVRVDTWSNEEQLTHANVADHPRSARAHTARANVLAKYQLGDEVIEHLRIAYELEAWNPGAAIHRLAAACVFSKLEPDIINEAKTSLASGYLTAYAWLSIDSLVSNIESKHCQMNDADVLDVLGAIDHNRRGLTSDAQGKKMFFLARFYQSRGDDRKTIEFYDSAIALDEEVTAYAISKAKFLIKSGYLEEARAAVFSIIEMDKNSLRDETKNIKALFSMLMDAELEVMGNAN